MKRRPEGPAAIVNGLLVLLLPPLLSVIARYVFEGHSNTSVTVRASDASAMMDALRGFMGVEVFLLPFAIFAGWRTAVHARRWLECRSSGWQGVGESGATAACLALLVLTPGIVRRPTEAPPYVLFYGGAALAAGLIVGLVLRTTALLVLRAQGRHRRSMP